MNPITIFFLIMALLGLVDKFFQNRWGIGEAFDSGSALMGGFMVFVMGVYCLGVTVSTNFLPQIHAATEGWFFEPSVLIGIIVDSDMGGYPLCVNTAPDEALGRFAGIAVASTIGTLITFYLPAYISMAEKEDVDRLIEGFLYGIVVLPVTLGISGILFGVAPAVLLKNMIPILAVCLLLLAGLIKKRALTSRVLYLVGRAFTVLSYVAFAMALLSLFFPDRSLMDPSLVADTIVLVFRMTVNIIGALVTMQLLKKILSRQFQALAGKLGINEYSMMGLLLGIPGGIAMIPLLPKMDRKGKILNGAFAVSGFYALGGQMALFAANEPLSCLMCFFFVKLSGGFLALLLANKMEQANKTETPA